MLVGAIADAIGPWYTVLGFLAVVVSLFVYIRKGLRSIQGEQKQTQVIAQNAADSAGDAAHAANKAELHAKNASNSAGNANDSSNQVEQAIILLASELGDLKHQLADALEVKEHLKERTDDLFGALALAEARRKTGNPESLPGQGGAALDTGETTITGKHRLHTSVIPTNQTPTQDDDFL